MALFAMTIFGPLAGCSSSPTASSPTASSPTISVPGVTAPTTASSTPSSSPAADPAAVKADELGAIPVLMYHQLLAHPTGAYDQTPGQFRAELESLYRSGFRTITAADLVAGRIAVPAGKSPMVLTFDDATTSQYAEGPDGAPLPDTAVAILQSVAKQYGEQRPVATFYVNARPFGNHPAYLTHLHALGMEIGDHTATHANLRQLDDAGVQSELVAGQGVITAVLPGVAVTTMALPFGVLPHNRALDAKGSAGGTSYAFEGVFLVGSGPSRSPFAAGFDPLGVQRIRSGLRTGDQAFTATYWLPLLISGKITRFVSDGDPATIAFPKAEMARLNPGFASRARPY